MLDTDKILQAKIVREVVEWRMLWFEAAPELITFVASRRGGSLEGHILAIYPGNLNITAYIAFKDDGPDAMIRIPIPGIVAFRDEQVTNEAHLMMFVREHAILPLPRLIDFGTNEVGPGGLGPYLIIEFVDGVQMSEMILPSRHGVLERMSLRDLDLASEKMMALHRQMAHYLTHLSLLTFDQIGALAKDIETGSWSVSGRPLTLDTNLLVTQRGYPQEFIATTTFVTGEQYLSYLSEQQLRNFVTQRNAASDHETAQTIYRSRRALKTLVDVRCRNQGYGKGPFKIFCERLCPKNIIVDPITWEIKAFTNLSYSNVMPSEFSSAPPSWLMTVGPCHWIQQGLNLHAWTMMYATSMQAFLAEFRRFEDRYPHLYSRAEDRLSRKMIMAWADGTFWLNLAAMNCGEVDVIINHSLDEFFTNEMARQGNRDDHTDHNAESLLVGKVDDYKEYKTALSQMEGIY